MVFSVSSTCPSVLTSEPHMDATLFHAINSLAGHFDPIDDTFEFASRSLPLAIIPLLLALWFWPGSRATRDVRQWACIAASRLGRARARYQPGHHPSLGSTSPVRRALCCPAALPVARPLVSQRPCGLRLRCGGCGTPQPPAGGTHRARYRGHCQLLAHLRRGALRERRGRGWRDRSVDGWSCPGSAAARAAAHRAAVAPRAAPASRVIGHTY